MYTRHRDQLSNGLKIVTLEVPHLHSALLAIYVRCGSRHEHRRNNGVSHFLEHMFFRGSERFPDTVVMNGLVEDAGGSLNGVTMRDQGFYYTPLHPARLPVAFDVLGDMLCAPRLEHIDIEREIILEELQDEIDAQGRDIDIGNLSRRQLFGDHPLGLKIGGTPETVRAMDVGMLREQLGRFYVGHNMVVAAAGPIDRRQVVELTERAFSRLPAGVRAQEERPVVPANGPGFLFVAHDESQTDLQLSFPCPPEEHPDYFALSLMRSVLDEGLSSWLPLNIVERRGLAYSVHAGLDAFNDLALFELEASCTPAKVVPVFEQMIVQLRRLKDERLSDEELERVKSRQRIGLEFALDDLNALTGWYGATELFREPETFDDRMRRLEEVTAEQLLDVARRTFTRENLRVCAVGPNGDRAEAKLGRAIAQVEL